MIKEETHEQMVVFGIINFIPHLPNGMPLLGNPIQNPHPTAFRLTKKHLSICNYSLKAHQNNP